MKTRISSVIMLALALTLPVATLLIAAQARKGANVAPPRPKGPPLPTLVKLSQETGQKKYLDAATKAAEYLWTNHLHGITGLEEFDNDLYQRLAKGH